MTEEELTQQKGAEVTALVQSFVTSGRQTAGNPQFIAELNVINQKYDSLIQQAQQQQQVQQQQQQVQQQTTTQDTGALANVGTDTQQQDTQPEMVYGSDGSLQGLIGGKPRFLTFQDPETGRVFQYNYEKQEYQGLGPDYYKADNLQLIGAMGEDPRKEGEFVSVNIDPTEFQYGGVNTPEQADKLAAEANREPGYESGGGGLFYEYNGRSYYTPDNTGQGIPVGSTNITRDPTQVYSIEQDPMGTGFGKVKKDPSTYTQPVLTKTFQGYEPVTGMYSDVEGITPEQYAQLSPAEKLKLSQSDVPTASTDFKDFFDMGSGRFDLGGFFGMDIDPTTGTSGLVLSNPPSNQFNLGKFLNQTEAFGTQNFLRSQSTDVLNDIILGGNTLDALMGKNFKLPDGSLYYDKIYNVVDNSITDPTDMRRYGSTKSNADVTLTDFISGGGGAIEGFDMGQLEGFFNDLATNKNPVTGDTMYSDTAYSIDPFNISGGDDSLQYNYAYSQRPLTAQAVRAYKGGLGPYANVQYLTRYGYNPEIGDEILRYDEASGVYFDPITGLPIKPERLEGFALSDPETVELGGTESVYRGQMTTNPVTGEKLYYDAEGNPVTEEQYQLFTQPMETGVT